VAKRLHNLDGDDSDGDDDGDDDDDEVVMNHVRVVTFRR